MSHKQVNGEKPSSATLAHLASYPLLADLTTTIQSSPYTAKPLAITTNLTHTLATTFTPLLSTPLAYLHPYIARADSLCDTTLSSLDTNFPIVTRPTGEIYGEGKRVVYLPVIKGVQGKDWLTGTWKGELSKCGDKGVVAWGKAALATGWIVGGETLGYVKALVAEKKEEEVKDMKTSNPANENS